VVHTRQAQAQHLRAMHYCTCIKVDLEVVETCDCMARCDIQAYPMECKALQDKTAPTLCVKHQLALHK
jgi:hypothetical protein